MDCTKICKDCREEKAIDKFIKPHRTPKGRLSYRSRCDVCSSKLVLLWKRQWEEKNKNTTKTVLENKTCPKCKKNLEIRWFRITPKTKDGYSNWCFPCEKEYHKNRYIRVTNSSKPKIDGKTCSVCRLYRPSEDFCKCQMNPDGLSYKCRDCVSKLTKNNRARNKSKVTQRTRIYRESNPTVRLVEAIRNRVRNAIKTQSKSARSLELLGCTGAECMDYLEKLFWPGMTRQNYGRNGWVIDHITPIDSFDKSDPTWQFRAFHYTNLQPLWYIDNDKKKARLDWTPAESKFELPERLKPKS